MVNIIIAGESSIFQEWAGDLNEDRSLDVIDIVIMVEIILEG